MKNGLPCGRKPSYSRPICVFPSRATRELTQWDRVSFKLTQSATLDVTGLPIICSQKMLTAHPLPLREPRMLRGGGGRPNTLLTTKTRSVFHATSYPNPNKQNEFRMFIASVNAVAFQPCVPGSCLAIASSSVTPPRLAEQMARNDCCDWYNGQVKSLVWARQGHQGV